MAILFLCCRAFGAGPRYEFRGAWVTAWSSGFLTPEEADETILLAKEANINALFIQVRKTGDAYYKSNYEPRAANITGPPDYDPLAYLIEKVHAAGIEVHAWLNTFRVWTKADLPADPNHVVNAHPDWLTRTDSGDTKADEGLFLDPGVAEVQDYTFNVFLDLVKNYAIDGIHFDFVRYPGRAFGYAPAAVERFNLETSRKGAPSNEDPAWENWRRDQVTGLVRRIYKAVMAYNPRIKVTAATIPWGDCKNNFCDTTPFTLTYQDWRSWMQEGILDANIPMNYKDEGKQKNAREYRNWLDGFSRWRYGRQVFCGIDFNAKPEYVVRQLLAARRRNLDGMVGFSFNQTEARLELVQVLRTTIYSDRALVPEMRWKLGAEQRVSRVTYGKGIDAAMISGDLDRAITFFKQAIDIDPNYADAYFRLGRCYLRQEKYEESVKQFEKVLQIDPNYEAATKEMQKAKEGLGTREQGTGNREQTGGPSQ